MFTKTSISVKDLPAKLNIINDVPSIIAADLEITGDLITKGAIEIEGRINGSVQAENITIRKTGFVEGNLIGDNIQVDGEIKGIVKAKYLKLSSSCRINGTVIYESISVIDGAKVDGKFKNVNFSNNEETKKIEASKD